ncbi:MAG: GTPase Era [Actinobacteria bacterium]|nr:GTPase Era [Actinomycetota bacterium]MCL6096035.1 GTPase Era [Actinomycetota bacterium]
MRSGFVSFVGRSGVGKSTLINRMIGSKVSITSPRKHTTRRPVRAVLQGEDAQAVLVDTPGLISKGSALGARMYSSARAEMASADLVVMVVDASKKFSDGDHHLLAQVAKLSSPQMVVVNKIDKVSPMALIQYLAALSRICEDVNVDPAGYFPVSAVSGSGVEELSSAVLSNLPEGAPYYPSDVVSDASEEEFLAELVREQLLLHLREELPSQVACTVTEWSWPYVRCEIWVASPSQKGIVIGKKGSVLASVGARVREQLHPGLYLDLIVKVKKDWYKSEATLDDLRL